ncbi:MAG TPA: hypothetical protein VGY55_23975 [Pirellulales bacterium]|jgi:hypothetical protein|nr:hypothetical protein [Pirellulales bacterium]
MNYDVGRLLLEASRDPFHAVRGLAIQSHASLEQSLCSLLATFGDIREDVASVIFFKISNARARDDILEKLLKKKYGEKHAVFWHSVKILNGQVTQVRNEIVHWNVVNCVGDNGQELRLMPPAFWDVNPNSPYKTIADLNDFRVKCGFMGRLCNMFRFFLMPDRPPVWTPEQLQTWTDIFRQAVAYPPPDTHPLCQTTTAPELQPPSSVESQPPQS